MGVQREVLSADLQVENLETTGAKADAFFNKLEADMKRIDRTAADSTFGKDLASQLTDADKKAVKLSQEFQKLSRVDTKNRSLDTLRSQADKLQIAALNVSKQLQEIRAVDTKGKGAGFLEIVAQDAQTADLNLARLEKRLNHVRTQIAQRQAAGGDIPTTTVRGGRPGSSLGARFSNNLQSGLIAGIGFAAIERFGEQSIEAAKKADDAQRILQASAKDTGQSYTDLARRAGDFGDKNSLANSKAQESFASFVDFANKAARTDQLDLFQRRFADLATAKGISADKFGDVANQLSNLSGEAFQKLTGTKIDTFFDKYSASIGTTSDKLTDAQKQAAVFDEVIRKGATFNGEAEKRLNSLAGSVDKFNARWENLQATVGKGLAAGGNALFDLFSGNAGAQLAKGDAERQAAFQNQLVAQKKEAERQAEFLRSSDEKIRAASKNPLSSLENFALSKVNLTSGFFNQGDREKAIEAATADAKTFRDDLQKRIEKGLQGADLGLVKFINADFKKNQNLFDLDTRLKIQNDISGAFAAGFDKILHDATKTLPEIRKTLSEVLKSPDLTSADRDKVSAQFEAAIRKSVTEGKQKIRELGRSTDALFANLFNQAGANNPFIPVFSEAEKQIEAVRLATANLDKDLQTTAENMVRRQNDIVQFTARLDTNLQALDLRLSAGEFRSSGETQAAKEKRLFEELQRSREVSSFQRASIGGKESSFFIPEESFNRNIQTAIINGVKGSFDNGKPLENPFQTVFSATETIDRFLRSGSASINGKVGSFNSGADASKLTERQQRDFLEQIALAGATPQNIDAVVSSLAARRLNRNPDADLSIQQRLQKQLDLIESLTPAGDAERAIAERKIISLTQGIRPDQLTDSQRGAAATAREHEAARLEAAERNAQAARLENVAVNKRIDENIARLLKIAERDGLTGVIRIINDAEDSALVSLGKRPNDRSTEELMRR